MLSVEIWTLYLPLTFVPELMVIVMEFVETTVMDEKERVGKVQVDMTLVYPEALKSKLDPALFQRALARMK